jgi:hypothetical protein
MLFARLGLKIGASMWKSLEGRKRTWKQRRFAVWGAVAYALAVGLGTSRLLTGVESTFSRTGSVIFLVSMLLLTIKSALDAVPRND